jgi:hypothetical protein
MSLKQEFLTWWEAYFTRIHDMKKLIRTVSESSAAVTFFGVLQRTINSLNVATKLIRQIFKVNCGPTLPFVFSATNLRHTIEPEVMPA